MKKIIFIPVIILLFFTACKKNSFDVDVSDVKADVKLTRFDVELFTIPQDSLIYKIPQLRKKYGDFFDVYFTGLLGLGQPEQKDFYKKLDDFFLYCDQMDLTNEVWKVFPPDDDYIQNTLTQAFKHYRYYFPNDTIPHFYTSIAGFQVSVYIGNGFMGINLDKYLGENYKPYHSMFERYMYRRMSKEYIPVDIMRSYAIDRFPFNDSVNTVLTNMIYEGRLQYFLDAMLPDVPDTVKWGYTYLQWGWANDYEKNIWDYMVSQKILFSNKNFDIKTYTGEAPFTTPFKNNSAPRAGTFIGYKIVQSYVKNNNVSLQDLMNETDYMKIYNNSEYMP